MIETTELQAYAQLFANNTDQNIFLTGKAGTGKTTFLRHLQQTTSKQMAIVAPTGVAAINAGGTTIHSFFQLPLTPFIPSPEGRKDLVSKLQIRREQRKVIRELEMLVIDEISMVRADVLDALDTVLRHVRHRHHQAFGGVQLIFIGDLHQLSPIARNEEWDILSRFYNGIYFFNSQVYQEKPFVHIEFEKIFRQRDFRFIELLNEIRNNQLSTEGEKLLEERFKPDFSPIPDDNYITLTTHNYKANEINNSELGKINSKITTYEATVVGNFFEKNYPADYELHLKVGAKVMFVKNDTENPRRFYNGMIGVITHLHTDTIEIKSEENPDVIVLKPSRWDNVQYTTNDTDLTIQEEVIGTFSQFPLRLAWAITIHKSQGLTFEKAVIDAGDSFSSGQVYVALSRCRNLEGMVLKSRIEKSLLRVNQDIVKFSGYKNDIQEMDILLKKSEDDYQKKLLTDIYNFKSMNSISRQWLNSTLKNESSFNEETIQMLKAVFASVTEIDEVGEKFINQINRIVETYSIESAQLTERLEAASIYFIPKLKDIDDLLKDSPAITDSKSLAKDFDQYWDDLYAKLHQKIQWIKGVRNGFSIKLYFDLRKSLILPKLKNSSYSKTSKKALPQSAFPELAYRLYAVRNEIVDTKGIPVYFVASAQSIVEMSNYLPQNKKELLKIHGFGETRYSKYGELFLEEIRSFCEENNLTSRIDELIKTEKPRAPKKKKGDSARISYEAFISGKNIDEIAKERNLAYTTITGHLSDYILMGKLSFDQFLEPEDFELAKQIIEANKNSKETYYAILRDKVDSKKINFLTAWLKTKQ